MVFPLLSSKSKILRFFDENTQFDYTVRDVGTITGVDFNIVKTAMRELEKEGKVIKIRNRSQKGRWVSNVVNSYQKPQWLTEERKKELEIFSS